MPVLKQADVAPLLNDPTIVLDLGDLQRQADRLIAAAEQEAGRILEAARETAIDEGKRLRAEAEALGRADGERAGREAGEQRGHAEAMAAAEESLGQLQQHWAAALADWSGRRASDLALAREDVVALALAIAERVVHRTITFDHDVVVRQTESALRLLADARDVRITVHPDDRERLAEALPDLVRSLGASAHVELDEDPSVGAGGVVVRSGDGVVDAGIGRQIDRIAESLAPGRIDLPDAGGAAESAALEEDEADDDESLGAAA